MLSVPGALQDLHSLGQDWRDVTCWARPQAVLNLLLATMVPSHTQFILAQGDVALPS